MHDILIRYQTGNSFGSEDVEQTIDYQFEQRKTAKENVDRIDEHYRMYEKYGRNYHGHLDEMIAEYGDSRWFVHSDDESENFREFISLHSVRLILDNGKEFSYSCFWCGYFEFLYGASVQVARKEY